MRLVLGGVAAGLVFGTAMLYWIGHSGRRHERHDPLVQSAITISGAYLCFYCCDVLLQVSAVLAVVCAGTELAVYMWPLLCDHKWLERFWHTIEWLMNTALFLLAGLIIGGRCLLQVDPAWNARPAADGAAAESIGLSDLVWVGLSFVTVIVIRFVTLFTLLPCLRRLGYGMSVRYAVAAAWGGLRGAVGLALALSMDEELEKRGQIRTGKLVLLHTSGVILGSLVVNAPTMPLLLSMLRFTPVLATEGCRRQALLDVRKRVEKFAWREFRALQLHPRAPAGESWKERVVRAVTALRAGERLVSSAAVTGDTAGAPSAAAAMDWDDGGIQLSQLHRVVVTLADSGGAVQLTARLGRSEAPPEDVDGASIDTVARSSGSASAFSADPLWSLAGGDSYSLFPAALPSRRAGHHGQRRQADTRPAAEAHDHDRIGEEEAAAASDTAEASAPQSEGAEGPERAGLRASACASNAPNGAGKGEHPLPPDVAEHTFMRQVTDEGGWWRGLHPASPEGQITAGWPAARAKARRRWRIANVTISRLLRVREAMLSPPTPPVGSYPAPPLPPISPPLPALTIAVPLSPGDAGASPEPMRTTPEAVRQSSVGATSGYGRSMRPSDQMPSGDDAIDTETGRALMQARAIFLNLCKQSYHEQLAEGLVRRGPPRAGDWVGCGGTPGVQIGMSEAEQTGGPTLCLGARGVVCG